MDRVTRQVIGVGEREAGLFSFRGVPQARVLAVDGGKSMVLWHKRLGHPSEKVLRQVPCVSISSSLNKDGCDVCFRAKQPRESFPLSSRASRIFELVHCDLWGPYGFRSSCGASYFLTIVDDFSRSVWVFLLFNKLEVETMFLNFVALINRQFGQKIKRVRSDNGTEFKCLNAYFQKNGIIFETSCVGTPQQNGRVERKHKHILNVARALRFQGHLPLKFWGECVMAACYLINRTPSSVLNYKTPYECLFGKAPSLTEIRVFGCLAYAHNLQHKGNKFTSRTRKCVFLGYPFAKRGWTLYDLDTKQIFVSRDVKFFEHVFPMSELVLQDNLHSHERVGTNDVYVEDVEECIVHDDIEDAVPQLDATETLVVLDDRGANEEEEMGGGGTEHEGGVGLPVGIDGEAVAAPTVDGEAMFREEEAAEMGKGKRQKFPNSRYKGFVTHTNVDKKSPSERSPPPSSTSGTLYPMSHFVSYEHFSDAHRKYIGAVNAGKPPTSFKEAVQHDGWRQAMAAEIRALEEQETWVLQELPAGKKALGSMWVYTEKRDEHGVLQRLKARLVCFGNHQVEGIDYNETFAPVAKMVTVRTFLAIAAIKKWEIHQMDVHNAFLHGDLDEVYMKIPPGFERKGSNMVCRMKKSLYGLKQAPRCWFAKLATALQDYGFKQSYFDYSLFTLTRGRIQINVLVYVDDMIIAGNDKVAMSIFKDYLGKCFKMKDLGVLKYFLGLEIARSSQGIFMSQRKYALDIISETGLFGAKPAEFPMEQNHKLALAEGQLLDDPEQYRRLIGRLIYLGVTRPDLAYSVHILSQFMQKPREDHWEAALRLVRYLKKNPGQGILLRADNNLSLEGWCDSDWASCPLTRRSLSGWFVLLGYSPVSWKTKKQPTVSRSSAEAEYRSMAAITCGLKWLKQLLGELGVSHAKGMRLYCDSQSALHIAQNPVFHERTKHIEVDCHFVRDAITEGLIVPSYVSTQVQLADIFTKALGKQQFEFLLCKLGVRDLHAPT